MTGRLFRRRRPGLDVDVEAWINTRATTPTNSEPASTVYTELYDNHGAIMHEPTTVQTGAGATCVPCETPLIQLSDGSWRHTLGLNHPDRAGCVNAWPL